VSGEGKVAREARALVIIALGSNLGDARRNVLEAVKRLEVLSDHPLRVSSLWETSPVDCPPGSASFINAVVILVPRTEETPETLLARLQTLEKEFGRQPKVVMNEPRELDLDLIAFGGETRATRDLTLPHPRACVRRFVLEPLSELQPDLVLPGQSVTVAELLREMPPGGTLRRV